MCFSNQRVIDDGYKAFLRSFGGHSGDLTESKVDLEKYAKDLRTPGAIIYGAIDRRGVATPEFEAALRMLREERDDREYDKARVALMDF